MVWVFYVGMVVYLLAFAAAVYLMLEQSPNYGWALLPIMTLAMIVLVLSVWSMSSAQDRCGYQVTLEGNPMSVLHCEVVGE